MSQSRLLPSILVGVIALTLSACGGGGQGLRVDSDSILVTSTSIPDMTSGEPMNHVIPLTGGCGGPYVLQLIGGEMPDGLYLDNDAVAIRGVLLEDGDFDFTIQVTDSGCEPFASTTASFKMLITMGEIQVVSVLQDGNPSLIPAGAMPYNPDYPALPRTVYNDFVTLEMVVAGGHGPYTATLYDHPDIPNDGPMPLGSGVPQASTSITGAPVQVGPGGGPFLCTFRITDTIGGEGFFTAYWMVETPPIIIAMDDLEDGKCGEQYSATFVAVEGVPPFYHELVEDGLPDPYEIDVNPNPANPAADVIFNPVTDTPPDVTVPGALVKITNAVYAGFGNESNYHQTNPGGPPEGIFLFEETGAYSGIPRRRGTFSVNYHVVSTLVPNLFGQHAWKSFEFEIEQTDPVVQDATYTTDGEPFSPMPTPPTSPENPANPYNRIPDLEVGQAYELQFKAMGGVPEDGLNDHPHESQRVADGTPNTETPGAYAWGMNWGVDGQPVGSQFNTAGTTDGKLLVLEAEKDNLVPQGFQNIFPTVTDVQLPPTTASSDTQGLRLSVGPDQIVITESSTASTAGSSSSNAGYNTLHDQKMTIKKLFAYATPLVKTLQATRDLVADGVIPPTAGTLSGDPLATLLTNVDLIDTSANPAGWWNDTFNLNPKGARGLRHGDDQKARNYYASHYGYTYGGTSYTYAAQPTSTATAIPKCTTPTLTEDTSIGHYKSGGKLYVFQSASHFGIFILRGDTKIYMPAAFNKSTSGFRAFGDNWKPGPSAGIQSPSLMTPQIAVSPDGRFAAMKIVPALQSYVYSYSEYVFSNNNAGQSKILLFTLTGEKLWTDGSTDVPYKIISTGSSGSTTTGQFQWASSLTLTNNHLYYLCGNHYGYRDYGSFKQHYFYRYGLESGGSTGALIASSDPAWYNVPGIPMQASNHRHDRHFSTSTTSSYPYGVLYYGAANWSFGSAAPHPFRVSADGDTCAFVAGLRSSASISSNYATDHFMKHVWVDHDAGSGPVLTRVSSTLRRIPAGGGRMARLSAGGGMEYYYVHQHGRQSGPSSQFALSDDGLKAAIVVSRRTGYIYTGSSSTYGYPMYNWNTRDDIVAYDAVDGLWGNGNDVERQVTGNDTTSSPLFTNSPNFRWRFGALKFTDAGDGFVFWGGIDVYDPDYQGLTTSSYYDCHQFNGSLYSYKFSDQKVRHCLAGGSSGDGGSLDARGTTYPGTGTGFKANVGSSTWNVARTSNAGAISPNGGFVSPNGKYYYICNHGALSSSKGEQHRLVVVNISDLNGTADANGLKSGEGRAVGGWPSKFQFFPSYGSSNIYVTYKYYTQLYGYYGVGSAMSSIAMSDSGRVFFGAHSTTYGPYSLANQTGSAYYYGQISGPVWPTYYDYQGYGPFNGQLAVFDSQVGGDVKVLTTFPQSISTYSGSTRRYMKYIEVSPDGKSAAFVTAEAASYSYPVAHGREKLGYVTDIELNPTTGDFISRDNSAQSLVTALGRVGASMTFDANNSSLFYARGGTGNENSKQLFAEKLGASAPDGMNSGKRYNCLMGGR